MDKFSDLLGKTLLNVENIDDKELVFTLESGEKYRLYRDQDCCESVDIQDVIGELTDLIGSPLTMVEEVTHESGDNPPDAPRQGEDSFTWTFYKLATIKGYVTIRWYGESNGYYSETVDFGKA